MKKIIFVMLLMCMFFVLSAKTYTLKSLSEELKMPPKKLASYIEQADYKTPEAEFEISKTEIDKIQKQYEEQDKLGYALTIVGLGMFVVFFSLVLCGLVIGQLKHLGKPKKEKAKAQPVAQKASKKDEPKPDVSGDALVAAICALHLHIKETEEQNSMLLTWKRTPISMWRSQTRTNMPNAEFYRRRK